MKAVGCLFVRVTKSVECCFAAQDLVSAVFSPLPVRSRDAIPTPPRTCPRERVVYGCEIDVLGNCSFVVVVVVIVVECILACVFFRRVISAAPVIKPFSRRRTPPLVAELDSAATMHANRIRMNEAAARMAPPRDHNFALRRWLKTPVLIPEEDSTDLTDLSSYERSHSISMEVKKMSTQQKDSEDEGYESPVAPFREQLTDEELAQAIQKLLSKGIPVSQSTPQRDRLAIIFWFTCISPPIADLGIRGCGEVHNAVPEICKGASRQLSRDQPSARG